MSLFFISLFLALTRVSRRRQWQPTPVLLPGESHGQRNLVGYSPWGSEESDTTEWLHFHFSLSCIGKGNGNPLQCSLLENPRDDGTWWAAVYGSHRVGHDWSDLEEEEEDSSIFNFLRRLHILFSIVTAPIYIATNSVQVFLSHHHQDLFLCFDDSHSNSCEVISHCGFNLHFPYD